LCFIGVNLFLRQNGVKILFFGIGIPFDQWLNDFDLESLIQQYFIREAAIK
jgi:hypothetical protein